MISNVLKQAGRIKKICIVTNAPICCNPRVVKEADAFATAGFHVSVVAAQHASWVVEWDLKLSQGKKWEFHAFRYDRSNFKTTYRWLKSLLRQKAFLKMAETITFEGSVAELAYGRLHTELLKLACKQRADLYIGHNPQALGVVCKTAEKTRALAAYDFEDYYLGQFTEEQHKSLSFRLLSYLEAKYLPRLVYTTASSLGIAHAIEEQSRILKPVEIYNVFPWLDRLSLDGLIKDRQGPELSIYWFSQIISLDRGLLDVIRASAFLSKPVQIHLRGHISSAVKNEILSLMGQSLLKHKLFFHEPVEPHELLSRAVEHDVGLSSELNYLANRDLCVTNKLFIYLLAGIAVAATNTKGQRTVLNTCSDSGFLYPIGDYKSLAKLLQTYIDFPDILKKSKEAALRAAKDRWNWEMESQRLISLVQSISSRPPIL